MWSNGDVVALRHVNTRRLSHVWPTVVVEDSPDLVALYLQSGTPTLRRTRLDGSGWYVNLQEPLHRTRIGFDTTDHVLDLVVEPDGRWQWKDEDEFEAACRIRRFTREEAGRVRRAGKTAAAAIEARAWPFDSEWSAWRPEPSWPLPQLPAEWHVA